MIKGERLIINMEMSVIIDKALQKCPDREHD